MAAARFGRRATYFNVAVSCLTLLLIAWLPASTNGNSVVPCSSLKTQTLCQDVSDVCAFDPFQTKKCLTIGATACSGFKQQLACESNPACRWNLEISPTKGWFGHCIPFGTDIADPIISYPVKPQSCESFKTKKACFKFSGCGAAPSGKKKSKQAKCFTLATVFRMSFQFLDGCSQNYGLNACFNTTALPFGKTFMKFQDSSWYFVDRLEMIARKDTPTEGEVDGKITAVRVKVWYGHDPIPGRVFIYDISTQPAVQVKRYELIRNTIRICRDTTTLSSSGPFIGTLEELLVKSPSKILPALGVQSGFPTSSISGVFTLNIPSDPTASASASTTGPRYIMNSTSSNLIADVDKVWVNATVFGSLVANCDESSEMQQGEFLPLTNRKTLELPNVNGGGSGTADTSDPCFKTCLSLTTADAKQQCVKNCAENANREMVQARERAERENGTSERLSADQLLWVNLPDIKPSILSKFRSQAQNVMTVVNGDYGSICKTLPTLSNNQALLDNARSLVSALDGLDSGLAKPVELGLGKLFNIVSIVQRISNLVSDLDKQLGDVALILKLLSAIPAISGIITPIYSTFNTIRTNLVSSIQSKLKSVANSLSSFRTPVINILSVNEEVRKLLNMVSASVQTFLVDPVNVARCASPVDDVTGSINPLIQTAKNAVGSANNALAFLKSLVQSINNLLKAVSESAVQTVLDGVSKIKTFWDNTAGKVIYPLSNALSRKVSFKIPWMCKTTKTVTVNLPCGVKMCSHDVWCGASCSWRGCKSKYCSVDYPCGVNMCSRTTSVDIWLPCLKTVSYTVREILTGIANLLGGALDAAMAAVKPVLDAIPKLGIGLPPIPGLSAIPLNLDQAKQQLGDQVANQAKSALQNFAYSQVPSQLRCGLDAYINQGTLTSLFGCQPFDRLSNALLGITSAPTKLPTRKPTFAPATPKPTLLPTTRRPTRAPSTARPTIPYGFDWDGNHAPYSVSRGAHWYIWDGITILCDLVFQGDSNFVLYRANAGAVWASNTEGSSADKMTLQDDGNMIMTRGSAQVWSTNARINEARVSNDYVDVTMWYFTSGLCRVDIIHWLPDVGSTTSWHGSIVWSTGQKRRMLQDSNNNGLDDTEEPRPDEEIRKMIRYANGTKEVYLVDRTTGDETLVYGRNVEFAKL